MNHSPSHQELIDQAQQLEQKGLIDQAISTLNRALKLDPTSGPTYYQLGTLLYQTNQIPASIGAYKRSLVFTPNSASTHNNLGVAYNAIHQISPAQHHFQTAIHLKPDFALAHNNLGNMYKASGDFQAALDCYHQALHHHPQLSQAHHNLGVVYQKLGLLQQATFHFTQALSQNQNQSDSPTYVSDALVHSGNIDAAITTLETALTTDPHNILTNASFLHLLRQTCNWSKISRIEKKLRLLSQQSHPTAHNYHELPFSNITRSDNLQLNLTTASFWSHRLSQRVSHFLSPFSYSPKSRRRLLHIGYLSADFHNHATTHLISQLFPLHDRHRFKIHTYSYGPHINDFSRQHIHASSDVFRDLYLTPFPQSATQIHQDHIDILVDLKGYTLGTRLEIAALRPAPIQCCWLGYPGTTGADFFDYIITDPIVTPPHHQRYFSETFAYLPHTYQITDHLQPVTSTAYSKPDFSLPPHSFVFASFNHFYKIQPQLFYTWMKLLHHTPHSVLWLLKSLNTGEIHLKRHAARHNIDPNRLIFSSRLPKPEHLARLRLAHLCLDTKLTNGHTSTTDSLWAGVPIITIQGKHFASRVSSSLLQAIGLPQLITLNLDQYFHLAHHLATHPQKLLALRHQLSANIIKYPLFNTPMFIQSLENIYLQMYHRYLNHLPPQTITSKQAHLQ